MFLGSCVPQLHIADNGYLQKMAARAVQYDNTSNLIYIALNLNTYFQTFEGLHFLNLDVFEFKLNTSDLRYNEALSL